MLAKPVGESRMDIFGGTDRADLVRQLEVKKGLCLGGCGVRRLFRARFDDDSTSSSVSRRRFPVGVSADFVRSRSV